MFLVSPIYLCTFHFQFPVFNLAKQVGHVAVYQVGIVYDAIGGGKTVFVGVPRQHHGNVELIEFWYDSLLQIKYAMPIASGVGDVTEHD